MVGPQQYMRTSRPAGSSGTNSSTERDKVLKSLTPIRRIGREHTQPAGKLKGKRGGAAIPFTLSLPWTRPCRDRPRHESRCLLPERVVLVPSPDTFGLTPPPGVPAPSRPGGALVRVGPHPRAAGAEVRGRASPRG